MSYGPTPYAFEAAIKILLQRAPEGFRCSPVVYDLRQCCYTATVFVDVPGNAILMKPIDIADDASIYDGVAVSKLEADVRLAVDDIMKLTVPA